MKKTLFLLAVVFMATSAWAGSNLLKGQFSVSGTRQVQFSKGNLQYNPSQSEWRFAEHQTDWLGTQNTQLGEESFKDYIDLFGWSTSATDFGASSSTNNDDFQGDFVEWGVNMGEDWFTMTYDEWAYLRFGRANASDLIGVACVDGINGVILLPDTWVAPAGIVFTPGIAEEENNEAYATVNNFTAEQWKKMEDAGAVFLPAAGYKGMWTLVGAGRMGSYWSATPDKQSAFNFYFYSNVLNEGSDSRYIRSCVRLVMDVKKVPTDLLDATESVSADSKVMRNGRLVILRDGVEYNAQGAIVR